MATGLGDLRAAVVALAGADPAALPPGALADQVVELRQLIDGLEGTWSRLVAVLDGSGAAEAGTSAFLRLSCRLAPAASHGPGWCWRDGWPAAGGRGAALTAGEISVDHARVVANALEELAAADEHVGRRGGRTSAGGGAAAGPGPPPPRDRSRPPRARAGGAAAADETRHQRRHLDVATTFEGMVAVNGLLTPEGGELLMTALTPLSGPCSAPTTPAPRVSAAPTRSPSCATAGSTTRGSPPSRATARTSPSSSSSPRSPAHRPPASPP